MSLEVLIEVRIWLDFLFIIKELKGFIEILLDVVYRILFSFFIIWRRKGILIYLMKLIFSVYIIFFC